MFKLPLALTYGALALLAAAPIALPAASPRPAPAPQVHMLEIVTPSLPSGRQGTDYGASVNAFGGLAPYAFSLVAGNLPSGLTLDGGTGLIRGVAAMSGTTAFTVQVVDSEKPPQMATQNLNITIL